MKDLYVLRQEYELSVVITSCMVGSLQFCHSGAKSEKGFLFEICSHKSYTKSRIIGINHKGR